MSNQDRFCHSMKVRPEDLPRAVSIINQVCDGMVEWLDDDGDRSLWSDTPLEGVPDLSAVKAIGGGEIYIFTHDGEASPEAGAMVVQALLQEFPYLKPQVLNHGYGGMGGSIIVTRDGLRQIVPWMLANRQIEIDRLEAARKWLADKAFQLPVAIPLPEDRSRKESALWHGILRLAFRIELLKEKEIAI